MAQHNHESGDSHEARRENTAMQHSIDSRQIHDSDKRHVDASLHPQDVQGAITEHLKTMSDINSKPTAEGAAAERQYAQYKQELVNKVFDAQGNVSDKASTKDIAALYDLNNAEISATRDRATSIAKAGTNVISVAQFEDNKHSLPDKLGV